MDGIWIDPRWDGEKFYSMKTDKFHIMKTNKRFIKIFMKMDEELSKLSQREKFSYVNLGKFLATTNNIYNFSDNIHLTDKSSQIIATHLGDLLLNSISHPNSTAGNNREN
jgi:hypothetical protein